MLAFFLTCSSLRELQSCCFQFISFESVNSFMTCISWELYYDEGASEIKKDFKAIKHIPTYGIPDSVTIVIVENVGQEIKFSAKDRNYAGGEWEACQLGKTYSHQRE